MIVMGLWITFHFRLDSMKNVWGITVVQWVLQRSQTEQTVQLAFALRVRVGPLIAGIKPKMAMKRLPIAGARVAGATMGKHVKPIKIAWPVMVVPVENASTCPLDAMTASKMVTKRILIAAGLVVGKYPCVPLERTAKNMRIANRNFALLGFANNKAHVLTA